MSTQTWLQPNISQLLLLLLLLLLRQCTPLLLMLLVPLLQEMLALHLLQSGVAIIASGSPLQLRCLLHGVKAAGAVECTDSCAGWLLTAVATMA